MILELVCWTKEIDTLKMMQLMETSIDGTRWTAIGLPLTNTQQADISILVPSFVPRFYFHTPFGQAAWRTPF